MNPFIPWCNVYLRDDGIWIFPLNDRGGLRIMAGPAEKLPADADAVTLGNGVLSALSRSTRQEARHRGPQGNSDVPQSAGFKSYGDLERGAKYLTVTLDADCVRVSARAASAGSYGSVPGAEQTSRNDPALVGNLVRLLSRSCIARQWNVVQKSGAIGASPRQQDPNDLPVAFAYKRTWLAIKSVDGIAVCDALGLGEIQPCSWEEGIEKSYRSGVFVAPPVEGWTLAIGSHPSAEQLNFLPNLISLSGKFPTVFYFATHRIVGYEAWACASSGKILRAFAYLGERGEFLLNHGKRTPEEIELHIGTEDIERTPDEQDTLALAARWLLDPRDLDLCITACGPGWFGTR